MGHGGWTLWAFALCLLITTLNYESSPIFERPIQSSIVVFLFCGTFVLIAFIVIPRSKSFSTSSDGHTLFPFQNRPLLVPSGDLPPLQNTTSLLTTRKSFVLILPAGGVIFLRVELFRLVLSNRQCSFPDTEGLLPLLMAIYEWWYIRGRNNATMQDIHPTSLRAFGFGRTRYVLPASILTVASILNSFGIDGMRSTYICPDSAAKIVPFFQLLGTLLDAFALISIENVIRRMKANNDTEDAAVPKAVGSIFLLSAVFVFLGGILGLIIHLGQWKWVVSIDKSYVSSLTWYTFLFTVAIPCCIESYRDYNILQLVAFATFVCSYISGFQNAIKNQTAFILTFQAVNILSILFLFLGATLFLHFASLDPAISFKPAQRLIPRIPSSTYTLLAGLLIVRCIFQLPKSNTITHHPIDSLIRDAMLQSEAWIAQATTSKTLQEAAANYRRRYQRHPPPGFDAWYSFATEKSSLIIDDFDSIMEDIQPFWARKPSDIRHDTRVILADEWNDVAEISIRSGKAEIGPMIPTHRWMLDGVLALLEEFVSKLPDMDIAFNINDEPRIAVPWKAVQKLRQEGTPKGPLRQGISNAWSPDREQTWQRSDDFKDQKSPFKECSLLNSFATYGSIACPPNSAAQTSHLWDPRNLCILCAAPHSLGLFLQNWTFSASPCHQPDLAHLHGFYLSPAAFKPSHELLPVFSQSKSHGYADILYPSAWNYMDKVKYEPSDAYPDAPFESKRNALFWRGATSEGLSKDATWKGMARQRLVHLANNATEALPILVPHPTQPGSFTYDACLASSLPALGLDMDIAIVDEIARCWDADCTDEETEFGLVGKSDFQAHWSYRFLMDLDGAGFSGRFLPFLHSRSVVFKTALFREWWDDRLTAWRHFVPVDIRFHGLFSTLAYFAGAGTPNSHNKDESEKGQRRPLFPIMEPNIQAGARIAEDSRQWAEKVLRKEDMQVYMFRLLLEWGRLTDDRRDEIGFEG